MEEARVRALIEDLSSPDENLRLKAANAFVNARGEAARQALPGLRKLLHGDPNPAVKFLAKKALLNLGEDVDRPTRGSEVLPVATSADSFRVVGDGKVLWRVAQDLLKDEIQLVLGLMRTPDERVQDRLTYALERLGPGVVAGPLLQAYLEGESFSVARGDTSAPEAGGGVMAGDIEHVLHAAKLRHSGIDPATAAAMGNLLVPEVFEVLIDMLGDASAVYARGALAMLSTLEAPRVLEALVSALGKGHPVLDDPLLERVLALGRADPGHRKLVLATLTAAAARGGSARRLVLALRGLGRLGDMGSLDRLRTALESDIPQVRAEAVWALAGYDLPDTWLVSNIRPVLADPDPLPAACAAVALLGGSGASHARGALDRLMLGESEDRMALCRALTRTTSSEASSYLERLLRDDAKEVREAAVEATREIEEPAVVEFLGGMLADEDEQVAVAAIETVGRLRMDQYNDLLVLLVDETDSPRLRATMLCCLGRMRLEENVPTIAFYLGAEDPRVRANAIEGLELLGDPKSMSLIQLSLTDPSPRVVANAIKALWGWGELKAARKLGELLRGEAEAQAAACHALGEMALRVRDEAALVDSPILAAALRQTPRYAEFRHMLTG